MDCQQNPYPCSVAVGCWGHTSWFPFQGEDQDGSCCVLRVISEATRHPFALLIITVLRTKGAQFPKDRSLGEGGVLGLLEAGRLQKQKTS